MKIIVREMSTLEAVTDGNLKRKKEMKESDDNKIYGHDGDCSADVLSDGWN